MTPIKKIAAAAAAMTTALTACSCGVSNTRTDIDLPTKISFSWWGNDIRSDYTIMGINEYENDNSGIDVIPYSSDFAGYKENLDALFSCGKERDIIQINYSWLGEYSPDGEGFYDLNELSDTIDLSNFSEEELSYGTVNGKLNAVPISLNAVTFYYNETLFDKYGLDIPEHWDDLFACAEALSEDGIYTIETADIYCWLMLTAHEEQISGKAAFNPDGTSGFDADNYVSMMEFYKRLIDEKVMAYGIQYSKDRFTNGESAGQLLWVSDAQYYVMPLEESGNGKTVIGDYLTEEQFIRSGWYVKPTSLYAISKNTENPKQAAKLLNYLLNDPGMTVLQGTEKGVPLSRSALETLEANNMLNGTPYKASKQISETDTELALMPADLENSERYKTFFEKFDLYYYGQKTAEQAAEEFIEEMDGQT